MRLIDADALKKKAVMCPTVGNAETLLLDISDVENAPTIEERKTGKWKIYVISMLDGEGCRCSERGFEGAPYWEYCPHCGAIMEGAEE